MLAATAWDCFKAPGEWLRTLIAGRNCKKQRSSRDERWMNTDYGMTITCFLPVFVKNREIELRPQIAAFRIEARLSRYPRLEGSSLPLCSRTIYSPLLQGCTPRIFARFTMNE